MTIKKLAIAPGVNKENTQYTNEGRYWATEKVRFRQGTPEKIGGWTRKSTDTLIGTCRNLFAWATLTGQKMIAISTTAGPCVESSGNIERIQGNITEIGPVTLTPTTGSPLITVAAGIYTSGTSYVGCSIYLDTITSLGGAITGAVLHGWHIVTAQNLTTGLMTINVGVNATGSDAAGSSVYRRYEPYFSSIWNFASYGQDLVYGQRGGGLMLWSANSYAWAVPDPTFTVTIASPCVVTIPNPLKAQTNPTIVKVKMRSSGALPTGLVEGGTYYLLKSSAGDDSIMNLSSDALGMTLVNTSGTQSGTHYFDLGATSDFGLGGSPDGVSNHLALLVSDQSRFVMAFGCNELGGFATAGGYVNPMLVRWSDQEDYTDWTPSITNQAGSLQLSKGSTIVTAIQARQEILVWTDTSLYSMQYQGPPVVWGAQIVGENISIVGPNAVAYATGKAYWMGKDKFYVYDGSVSTLRCDLRQYVFGDIAITLSEVICSGTNEAFNEIWWFYPTAAATENDRYVVYNYQEDIWYHGALARTAWHDSPLFDYPLATNATNLLYQEYGVDDNATGTPAAISSSVESCEFDIDDGDTFGFVRRILPDITFRGSTTASPAATLTLIPMENSGSGYYNPQSEGGSSSAAVTRTSTTTIEQFTGQVYVRVRGRQMIFKLEQNQVGATWQMGSMRIDVRPDGRRG